MPRTASGLNAPALHMPFKQKIGVSFVITINAKFIIPGECFIVEQLFAGHWCA